jgi:hypothetical protein
LSTRSWRGIPQRANARRRTAWVSPAGTLFQDPRGENRGCEDRSGGLIADPHPTGLVAVGQRHLLAGVDLPGLVGHDGAAGRLGGASTGGCGIQSGADEGALQGAFAGEGPAGVLLGQDHPDQAGPPGGMLAPELRGEGDQFGIGPLRLVATAADVAGGNPRRALGAEAADQFPHRLGAQSQIGRDLLGPVVPLRPFEDRLPLRDRHGASHRGPPCCGSCGETIICLS